MCTKQSKTFSYLYCKRFITEVNNYQKDYIEAYKQSHRGNMLEKRYKIIESLYDDAEREMQRKQKTGTWN